MAYKLRRFNILVRFCSSCLIGLFVLFSANAISASLTQQYEKIVENIREEWKIPGVAVAIIENGKIKLAKGFGYRERGNNQPVNEFTLFQVGSLSKAFTAYATSRFVQKKLVDWNAPIIQYYADFHLNDKATTNNCTLIDLLSHRSGLPGLPDNSWKFWWHTNHSREELIKLLSNVPLKNSLRSHFNYNNMGYVLVAKTLEEVSGTSWEKILQKEIFIPLNMKNTFTNSSELQSKKNVAKAHLPPQIRKEPISWENFSTISPAAGIISCIHDMSLWLQFCISGNHALNKTLKPRTLLEIEGFLPKEDIPVANIFFHESPLVAYSLGWMIYNLNNNLVYLHTGLCDGMQSILAICPERKIGVVVLTNQAPNLGAACLLNTILDQLLNLPKKNWSELGRDCIKERTKIINEQRK